MKIRTKFVSNSSTSSFCIWGARIEQIDLDTFERLVGKEQVDEELKNFSIKYLPHDELSTMSNEDIFEEYSNSYKFSEIIESVFGGAGLECYRPFDADIYIGKAYHTIKDKETGKEFRESVEKELEEIFGNEIKCSCIEKAWRDG